MNLRDELRREQRKAKVGWRSYYNLKDATDALLKSLLEQGALSELNKKNIKRIYLAQEPNMRECSICTDTISNNISFGNCLHFYHSGCLSRVENNKCPDCRGDLTIRYTV